MYINRIWDVILFCFHFKSNTILLGESVELLLVLRCKIESTGIYSSTVGSVQLYRAVVVEKSTFSPNEWMVERHSTRCGVPHWRDNQQNLWRISSRAPFLEKEREREYSSIGSISLSLSLSLGTLFEELKGASSTQQIISIGTLSRAGQINQHT